MARKLSGEKEISFEERLEKLEALAEEMEQGNLPVRELMKAYEEGVELSSQLEAELDQAKARMMEIKLGKGKAPEAQPSDVVKQASLLDGLTAEE